jgi:hypothetical protein
MRIDAFNSEIRSLSTWSQCFRLENAPPLMGKVWMGENKINNEKYIDLGTYVEDFPPMIRSCWRKSCYNSYFTRPVMGIGF